MLGRNEAPLLLKSCGTAESIHDIQEILHNDLEVKVIEREAHDGQNQLFFFFSEGSHDDTKPGLSQAVLAIIMVIDFKKSRKLNNV